VGGGAGRGSVVRGWEVEVTGRAAEVQHRAAGSREGVEGGGPGGAELLRVVSCVVLCDNLLQVKGTGQGLSCWTLLGGVGQSPGSVLASWGTVDLPALSGPQVPQVHAWGRGLVIHTGNHR
jgi:hypothetical protein